MRLESFEVDHYRNILNSTSVSVQRDITCLVGKNESGKSALLEALWRLRPHEKAKFDQHADYPRWLLTKDRKSGKADECAPIRATFRLQKEDIGAVEEAFGKNILTDDILSFSWKYDGGSNASLQVDSKQALKNFLGASSFNQARGAVGSATDLDGLSSAIDEKIESLDAEADSALIAQLRQLQDATKELLGDSTVWQKSVSILRRRIPTFFYFGEYQLLPGRIDLDELDADEETPGATGLQAARALLRLADTDTDSLRGDEYEHRKAELEAVSNELSDQVFEYWRQNKELTVEIDIDKATVSRPSANGTNLTAVAKYLDIRVKDRRHGFTGNFSQRSSGFRWFFSFLAAFSEFEDSDEGVIVLLDEPALTLHGKAQADYLRFIEERLAPKAQVIYTTHSPFMVEPGHMERVRVIEDKGPKEGAVVSQEVMSVDSDTLFPLQAALGYDIAQSLFIGNANLVVEGTSDFTYLTVISDYLATLSRTHLAADWRILPAGGSANVPAFVALAGRALDVTVLVDSGAEGMQRLEKMTTTGLLRKKRLLTVGNILGQKNADVEDLFSADDYLQLYNGAFATNLIASSLPQGDRIVSRITQLTGAKFVDHGLPSDYFLRNRDHLLGSLSSTTLDRFEDVFKAINATKGSRKS